MTALLEVPRVIYHRKPRAASTVASPVSTPSLFDRAAEEPCTGLETAPGQSTGDRKFERSAPPSQPTPTPTTPVPRMSMLQQFLQVFSVSPGGPKIRVTYDRRPFILEEPPEIEPVDRPSPHSSPVPRVVDWFGSLPNIANDGINMAMPNSIVSGLNPCEDPQTQPGHLDISGLAADSAAPLYIPIEIADPSKVQSPLVFDIESPCVTVSVSSLRCASVSTSTTWISLLGRQQLISILDETSMVVEDNPDTAEYPSFPYRKPPTVTQNSVLQTPRLTESALSTVSSTTGSVATTDSMRKTTKKVPGLGLGLPSNLSLRIKGGRDSQSSQLEIPSSTLGYHLYDATGSISVSASLIGLFSASSTASSLAPSTSVATSLSRSPVPPSFDPHAASLVSSPCATPIIASISRFTSSPALSSPELPIEIALNFLKPRKFPQRELYNIREMLSPVGSSYASTSKAPPLPLPELPAYMDGSAISTPAHFSLGVVSDTRQDDAAEQNPDTFSQRTSTKNILRRATSKSIKSWKIQKKNNSNFSPQPKLRQIESPELSSFSTSTPARRPDSPTRSPFLAHLAIPRKLGFVGRGRRDGSPKAGRFDTLQTLF